MPTVISERFNDGTDKITKRNKCIEEASSVLHVFVYIVTKKVFFLLKVVKKAWPLKALAQPARFATIIQRTCSNIVLHKPSD